LTLRLRSGEWLGLTHNDGGPEIPRRSARHSQKALGAVRDRVTLPRRTPR